jgi:hypothetical protein
VYRRNAVTATLTTGVMFLLFTCMHFLVWGIVRYSSCAPTACEMVCDCRKFEKHCPRLCTSIESHGGLILTGITPDSPTRAPWQCYKRSHLVAKQEVHSEEILNFACEVSLTYSVGSLTCCKSTTWDRRIYYLFEGSRASDFYRP